MTELSRREFGLGLGILVATIPLWSPPASGDPVEGAAPVSFAKNPRLNGWIRISTDNKVTIFTGKAELGQGILTALAQIAADELDVSLGQVHMVSADTTRGPDEGYTVGSQSIQQSGAALRAAGAQARAVLLAAASAHFKVGPETLSVDAGIVCTKDGRHMTYGRLAESDPALLDRDVSKLVRPKNPAQYKLVGKPIQRIDLPDKVAGRPVFLHDLRFPGMLFGRIIRPPHPGAKLLSYDGAAARAMPGIVDIVRNGSFLGVIAEREEQAIAARESIRESSRWSEDGPIFPNAATLADDLKQFAHEDIVVSETGQSGPAPEISLRLSASYSRPYLSHGSIGPSCAVARYAEGRMTVWSHTQGAFPLREDLATVLEMPISAVDVTHVQGAGCYGHNGADDVSLDAALLARAVEGRAVKVQWMRDDEFAWSPTAPGMVMDVSAGLSQDGKIVDWTYDLWSNSHAARPGQAGGVNLLASWYLEKPYHPSPPLKIPQPYGNGDRNAVPLYDLPRRRIVNHLLTEAPIRTGSLRTLGAQGNIFAIECFMDELAAAAGRDPIEFRLAHLSDPRRRAVVETAARVSQWVPGSAGNGRLGRGFAYTRYKNISAYAAVVVDIDLDPSTGRIRILKAVCVADVGQVINPDGVANQIEGGLVQGLSWALKEQMSFDERAITSQDWSTYPIASFEEVPPIDVVTMDRPNDPNIGAGEASVAPASAALANALANATGRRLRNLPLTPEAVRNALQADIGGSS